MLAGLVGGAVSEEVAESGVYFTVRVGVPSEPLTLSCPQALSLAITHRKVLSYHSDLVVTTRVIS